MANLIGLKGERTLSEFGFTRQMVSMGHQACGALVLWNYPRWLRNLVVQDMEGKERPDPVDLAALEGTFKSIIDRSVVLLFIDRLLSG